MTDFRPFGWTILLLILLQQACWAQELKFTAIPSNDIHKEVTIYKLVEEFLSDQLGVSVRFVPSTNYQSAIDLFEKGEVDLGWVGGVTGLLARHNTAGIKVIAQGFEDQYFKSYFITRRDRGLKYSEHLPENTSDLTLTFGPRLSTSGRLMPEYYIRKILSKKPEQAFKSVGYSKNHKDTIARIRSGEFDIGAVNYREWLDHIQLKRPGFEKMIIVWETPAYHDYHWIYKPNSKTENQLTYERVQQAILAMNGQRELLKVFGRSHFIGSKESNFSVLEDIAKQLNLLVAGSQN